MIFQVVNSIGSTSSSAPKGVTKATPNSLALSTCDDCSVSSSTSSSSFCKNTTSSTSTSPSSIIPRVNLRKRTVSGEHNACFNLSTVNSAFLSGLFADVAQVQEPSSDESFIIPSGTNAVTNTSATATDTATESSIDAPIKKKMRSCASSLQLSRSLSRCNKSFKRLSDCLVSPTGVADQQYVSFDREDSLLFQLSCVSNANNYDSINNTSDMSAVSGNASSFTPSDAVKLAFPHLPVTISNSSCCPTLTRKLSDLQSSLIENSQKESYYGWFVDMEEEDGAKSNYGKAATITTTTSTNDIVSATAATFSGNQSDYAYNATPAAAVISKHQDLAFIAATAPKATNYDAEVEWAQAADTVDDVLGDFF